MKIFIKTFRVLKRYFGALPLVLALRVTLQLFVLRILNKTANIYYSQTGEDIIINHYFGNLENGYYVDVGCNEPMYISSTFNLYLKGWTGINIDANDKLIHKFKKIRISDISVCAAVSDQITRVVLFGFLQDNYNTIEPSVYNRFKNDLPIGTNKIMETTTLTAILDKYLPADRSIDLLTIDVEGHDFQVLKSLDLTIYSPKLIVIEIHDLNLYNILENPIVEYLNSFNYSLIGYVTMNAYFLKKASGL